MDDAADGLVHLMKVSSSLEQVYVGSGGDVTIYELAQIVAKIVGFEGEIVTDTSRPDGTPRKLMSADKLKALGWRPQTSLAESLLRNLSVVAGERGLKAGGRNQVSGARRAISPIFRWRYFCRNAA